MSALSFYEVELLRLLWERAGQPVSREEILEKIWGVSGHATTRSVDNFVVKLRKKIEENAAKPRHIVTIYGTGYKLCPLMPSRALRRRDLLAGGAGAVGLAALGRRASAAPRSRGRRRLGRA